VRRFRWWHFDNRRSFNPERSRHGWNGARTEAGRA
jgi:hypothetical protein